MWTMLSRESIRQALERLNILLAAAVERVEQRLGVKFGQAPFLGLAVEPADALRGMENPAPGRPHPELTEWPRLIADDALFATLKQVIRQLDATDFGLLLLALAPEFNTGYEKVFGFLQDDVTRRRASVELATLLFDPNRDSCVIPRLNGSAPLLANRLIDLAEPSDGQTGLTAKVLRLDEQFLRWAFGINTLDRRLAAVAELTPSKWELKELPVSDRIRSSLERIGRLRPMRLYLHGPDSRVNLRAAEGLARLLDRRLLLADAVRVASWDGSSGEIARLLLREANWFTHLLVLIKLDALHAPEQKRGWEQLSAALGRQSTSHLVMIGTRPTLPPTLDPLAVISLEIPLGDTDERFEHWTDVLRPLPTRVSAMDIQLLADRYSLTRTQIELAATEASARARLRAAQAESMEEHEVEFEDLAIAARAQGGHDLETLTNKIVPRVRLADVVLPADVHDQLTEIASRVLNRTWVHRDWGFVRRQSHGLGVNALFAGPPGTGKTMAAEALAHALGKDLYKIDLTSVVSKYIGETEQKLEQVFKAGEATQAVLFFDEADSLLGKRSEVKDAHDRYANLEVSYLLQRMERYDGLIILATNLLGNLDEAFLRRMAAIVHFPQPTANDRLTLWTKAWPTDERGRVTVPLASEPGYAIDFKSLAERFELTGGNIRNAVIAAAFVAADRHWFRFVTMWDVLRGVRREFQKLGRVMTDGELGLDKVSVPPPRPPASGRPARPRTTATERKQELGENPSDDLREAGSQQRTPDPKVAPPAPAPGRQSGGAEVAEGSPQGYRGTG
jgi:SpoVK/Ycf46/Vps4 family AAA+-type ATPase